MLKMFHKLIIIVIFCYFLSEKSIIAAQVLMDLNSNACFNWQNSSEALVGNCTYFSYGNDTIMQCFGGTKNLKYLKEEQLNATNEMVLCGWPKKVFNPVMELKHFLFIKSLIMEYGGFNEIIYDFPYMQNLRIINISWTNLSHINLRTFKRVQNLTVLDLRFNQLKQLDASFSLPRYLEQVYLVGNPWNCTRNFKWLLLPEKGSIVADRNDIICADRKYKDRNMMIVMNYKVILRNECQSHVDLMNCSCLMHHIIPKSHHPLYTVNCSNLQFLHFPSYLPENTSTLYLNDNFITDISPLSNNPHYRNVMDIHLMNNMVESIDQLEGSYWLENFRLLNLQNNRLLKLPMYAVMNALETNDNANLMWLGGNPWHCSCKFSMRFKDMLSKYNELVRDASNITCNFPRGKENERLKLLTLSRHDVCDPPEEPALYILDLVNALLASLIILILGKLVYDYYQYKYYGRVPCIVMKIP